MVKRSAAWPRIASAGPGCDYYVAITGKTESSVLAPESRWLIRAEKKL
jgi:hypothetical protein